MKILLSIKPEFAEMIFTGSKLYEYRRALYRNPKVKTVVVYASAPMQRVIGEFDIDLVLNQPLEELWQKTGQQGGISKEFFMSYFRGKDLGFAIKVKKTIRYKRAMFLDELGISTPPQSFAYLADKAA